MSLVKILILPLFLPDFKLKTKLLFYEKLSFRRFNVRFISDKQIILHVYIAKTISFRNLLFHWKTPFYYT